ncbi:hypothetical protein ACG33_10020 [Steroidobacter denitrificans]|uniref:Uncharacterized protein n=1 Tax=Steroidobacter denitrificans TaxID=465721 RepID=A0A127FAH9_STEDE|nr:hypothetical protein ACG33_10020 [Steroidobacter denitrificans]
MDCHGPGGNSTGSLRIEIEPLPPGMALVSGRITFDRVVFKSVGSGLDPAAAVVSPVRQAIVEALAGNEILASTLSHLDGHYALRVPVNRSILVRVKAQMLRTAGASSWNFAVRNNTNDRLYALDSSTFDTGDSGGMLDLHASSGWDGSSYTGVRAAAPFAILDTAFQAKALILSAAPAAVLPALNFYWSPDNRGIVGEFCPATGSIGTSFYVGAGFRDGCATPGELPAGIYLLGAFDGGAGDTDEFDPHVIAHEFGHYYEDRLSRSDSIGGAHGPLDRLDLRVAFSEGWGNAFAGMALNDPVYRDSHSGVTRDFYFDLESGFAPAPQGWFSEMSVGEILWDVFDDDAELRDPVALGFTPIHAVMTGAQVNTEALTSIFSFADALRRANPASSTAIRDLLSTKGISGTDAFGSNETNAGGDVDVLPIYRDITLDGPVTNLCSRATAGSEDGNKLGNNRFLRFDNGAERIVTIQAVGAALDPSTVAATDPVIYVYRRGAPVAMGLSDTVGAETIAHLPLSVGTYIIEVHDWDLTGTNTPPRCMTVSITGQS